MSAIKSGSSLRSLVLTPQRIPSFIIPSRSPRLFLSPQLHRTSDRTRLLSDPDDDSPGSSPPPAVSPQFLLRPLRVKPPCCPAPAAAESADTDLTTYAAMSLPHVAKVTTPYGFRAVLAASPSTQRRESLFHRNKPVRVTVTDHDQQDPEHPSPAPCRPRVSLPPGKTLALQLLKELKKPAAALKALSPALKALSPARKALSPARKALSPARKAWSPAPMRPHPC